MTRELFLNLRIIIKTLYLETLKDNSWFDTASYTSSCHYRLCLQKQVAGELEHLDRQLSDTNIDLFANTLAEVSFTAGYIYF